MLTEVNPLPRPRRWFHPSNLFTVAGLLLLACMLAFPEVKATMIAGLMKVGLFHADFKSEQRPAPVVAAGDLLLTDTAGKTIRLSDLRGSVVVLNFWATWCPPCRAELPSLQKLADRWKGKPGLVILTVDVDGTLAKSRHFLDHRHRRLPVYAVSGSVPSEWLGSAVPTTDVFDKKGALSVHHEGAVNFDAAAMDQYLQDLQ